MNERTILSIWTDFAIGYCSMHTVSVIHKVPMLLILHVYIFSKPFMECLQSPSKCISRISVIRTSLYLTYVVKVGPSSGPPIIASNNRDAAFFIMCFLAVLLYNIHIPGAVPFNSVPFNSLWWEKRRGSRLRKQRIMLSYWKHVVTFSQCKNHECACFWWLCQNNARVLAYSMEKGI